MKLTVNLLAALALTLGLSACFIDNPNQVQSVADAGGDAAATDGGAGELVDAGPNLCTKYGGYPTVEVIVGKLFSALVADCRISQFFTTLTPERQGHLYDCLVDQVAVLLRCEGIRYDVDNQGVECRDMRSSHKGLAIRSADFDALVEDLVGVLVELQVEQADIEAIAPSVLSLREDIVTNSAPGMAKPVCEAGAP